MTRLLVIGASGLEWSSFSSHSHPHLDALRQRGVAGLLRAPEPLSGPAPWVSLVTGQMPETHGVWRAEEAWPGGVRRISRASWRAPPVWAQLAAAGVSTASVAWPAARPGAAWVGDHIDRDFVEATGKRAEDWALPLDCMPADLREPLRGLRVHPTALPGAALLPLVPSLDGIEQGRDARLPSLAVAMSHAATVQAAATWLLTERQPEAMFVHHAWLGEVLALFERETSPDYADVIEGAWRFLDGMIGRLASLAGPEAMVLVASPGWRGRPGVLVAAGPTVRRDDGFAGADLVRVAPTALALFGLRDPAQPPPIGILVAAQDLRAAPAVEPAPSPSVDRALLGEAIAAGYAPQPPPPAAWRAFGLTELAMLLMARDPAAALQAAEAAVVQDPGFAPALAAKAMALVSLETPEPLPAVGRKLSRLAPKRGWGAMAQGAYHVMTGDLAQARGWLSKAEADADPQVQSRIAALWFAAGRPADAERVFRALLARDPQDAMAEVGLGMALASRRDFRGAEEALGRALKLDPGRAAAYLQLALIYGRTARQDEAQRASAKALSLGATASQVQAALEGRLES